MRKPTVLVVFALLTAAFPLVGQLPAQVPGKVDFRRDVQPLLKEYCIGCHGPTQQKIGRAHV